MINTDRQPVNKESILGAGVAIGAGVGAAIGTALGNIAMGVGIGVALGIAFAATRLRREKDDSKE
ncbi:MAG TPA: hypothetical protein DHW15_11245 [Bacteroidetes bacterium]|nr:MAG: hypothetical protein ABR95_07930 [Sphingobacteriales bacterium BACL12 MAG-120813-bin55]HCK22703.1 hypothetical protein [Bacteroidota bacterium]